MAIELMIKSGPVKPITDFSRAILGLTGSDLTSNKLNKFVTTLSKFYAKVNGFFVESLPPKNTPATAKNKKLVIIQLEFLFIDGSG